MQVFVGVPAPSKRGWKGTGVVSWVQLLLLHRGAKGNSTGVCTQIPQITPKAFYHPFLSLLGTETL